MKRTQNLLHGEITKIIIGNFLQVFYELGPGFNESVYSRALGYALGDAGLRTQREFPVTVYFRGREAGLFRADHVVESLIVLELKAGPRIPDGSDAQLLNLLCATRFEVGLLLHFGLRPEFRRLVYTNDRKLLP